MYCQSALSGFMYLYGFDLMGFTCGVLIKANLIFFLFSIIHTICYEDLSLYVFVGFY